ncbi:hypothetical protein [Cyanobacterium sp. Dongsha4]|uniref:hypothetical protein n=1 Tax=Cyanobacterium sp. DS4 TaxID=2878255 RepID=UPI002E82217F|nr:hypothetical protein [Cyanobacterium sp. Dongsha4]WVL02557.1 hypothetical protein Dongsha4_18890 [Cyanobacterium sp. Dongsha4]
MFDHEKRIKQLEKKVEQLERMLLSQSSKWLPVKEATSYLLVSKQVLYNRIKNGNFTLGKDYRMNGNRYIFNVNSIEKKLQKKRDYCI